MQRFGSNTLPEKRPVALSDVVLRQFKNPLIFILFLASVTSFGIGKSTDGFFLAVITVNAIIGTLQEWKSEKSAQSLQALLRIMARVHRHRHVVTTDAGEIVPGDINFLAESDRVPADIGVLRQSSLRIDESLLSGESLPVEKGVSPVTFEEWIVYLGIALVLVAVMEVYKFAGNARRKGTGR
ncbi:MAG: magnesium-transporting ATPase MgtA [Methanoregula sp. PtaU1.Bin051]|nr:MAG: magnesium-transporting ATPase MgtA [Methanoregula sp. PtaU1.Bin051]